MKRLLILLATSVVICGSVAIDARATTTDFTIQILPLACSHDTVALGQTTARYITPEACRSLPVQVARPEDMVSSLAPHGGPFPSSFENIQINPASKKNFHTGSETSRIRPPFFVGIYPPIVFGLIALIEVFSSSAGPLLFHRYRVFNLRSRGE
jgi:hypothetical protein